MGQTAAHRETESHSSPGPETQGQKPAAGTDIHGEALNYIWKVVRGVVWISLRVKRSEET